MNLGLLGMATSQKTRKESQRKHREEASTQPKSTPHRGSSDLGEDCRPIPPFLEPPIEILEECGTSCEAIPHPSPSFQIEKSLEQNRGR